MRNGLLTVCCGVLLAFGLQAATVQEQLTKTATAQALSEQALAPVIERALQSFNTPGMAVGISFQGERLHLAGYGQRDLAQQLPVNAQTYFRLASASKAFTAASVAILVDEGKLNWDDKVISHLPAFRLKDPWVTAEFTIRDLLSHRSGLVSAAGDSMIWPEPSGFSRAEVIHNLRFLTPEFGFRSRYSYSNVLYITAAELVATVSGQPWEQFVAERIFSPLQMQCFAGAMPSTSLSNIALGYRFDADSGFIEIPRNHINGQGLMSAAAGGVVCSAADTLNWLEYLLQLQQGKAVPQVFSARQLAQMWSPQTIMTASARDQQLNQTHFSHYGLGWRMHDMHGFKVITHTGTLSGYQAYVALVPAQQLAVVLLNNGSDSGARNAVMQTILKALVPELEQVDWIADEQEQQELRRQRAAARVELPVGTGQVQLPLADYSGDFADQWFGAMQLTEQAGQLRIESARMLNLRGSLTPFVDHSFVIKWDDANAARDSFIHFQVNGLRQVTGFTLSPFAVEAPLAHEWRDMLFLKKQM
ncbi:serine hydrolase [Arsukibacterium sp.]|uniref:serine hydrolase n=1 Tax=Arsukibacterium sp. TaxID=1977258 RepID=UPI002FDA8A51